MGRLYPVAGRVTPNFCALDSGNLIVYYVYGQLIELRTLRPMLGFFENTWFIWWVVAAIAILRWFHVISARPDRYLGWAAEEHASPALPVQTTAQSS